MVAAAAPGNKVSNAHLPLLSMLLKCALPRRWDTGWLASGIRCKACLLLLCDLAWLVFPLGLRDVRRQSSQHGSITYLNGQPGCGFQAIEFWSPAASKHHIAAQACGFLRAAQPDGGRR